MFEKTRKPTKIKLLFSNFPGQHAEPVRTNDYGFNN